MIYISYNDIYLDWLLIVKSQLITNRDYSNALRNYSLAPMILDIQIPDCDKVWVAYNPSETDKQKCVIETIYDEIIYRKFNPFIDQYIHSYFEVDEYKKVALVEQMKCNFDNLFDVNSFAWIKSPQFIT